MRIFVTGATGFLGSAIVQQLLAAGHQVLGLTRSERGATALESWGAKAHFGDLDDFASLQHGADLADAVIHTAFNHDFSTFVANCEADGKVIGAMGKALAGSSRPMVITSFVAMGTTEPGKPATEAGYNVLTPNPRKATEIAGVSLLERGVNASFVRLPQVHDTVRQGLITPLIELAREKGVAAYIGEGKNRWSAVHVSDAVRLYVLAVERGIAGARYNAVAEEGITTKDIADVIGQGLGVPVRSIDADKASDHFGWLGNFAAHDMSASSLETQQKTGWRPVGPGLIEDLRHMQYR
ncbi:NAD-dependent dehydratase [Cedecea neteri]|uniref:NAD-dependent dehydratase n=1 Tax=Cedecea neteri TaxID=158822 RepID=A0A089PWZ9_9ENTR|nr:SDR family oxidoreductase [Cedecea neteri]AIR03446.1 NAD-dependent dehydratase [Cedecea neteri]